MRERLRAALKRPLPFALLALALGCASPPERVWVPDGAVLTFEQARSRCGSQHLSLDSQPGAMETGMLRYVLCMNSHGWYFVEREQVRGITDGR